MNTHNSRNEMDSDLELALKLSLEYSTNDAQNRNSIPGTSGLSNSSSEYFYDNRKSSDLELALKLSLEYSTGSAENRNSSPGTSARSNSSQKNFLDNRKRPVNVPDRYPAPKKVATANNHDKDYELALKLSEELNGQVPVPVPVNNETDDFALALRLSKEDDADDVVEIIDDDQEANDFMAAIRLTEDDFQAEITSQKKKVPEKSSNSKASHSSGQSGSSKRNYGDESMSVVDPTWETIDPVPDIYALFAAFNKRFFWGKLDSVEVKWSPRMTQCAGVCSYSPRAGFCSVRLSQPLLKFRPRKDLVETMLHEMIHAFLFVTRNDRDRDGHGPRFLEHMNRINKDSGANITVYHSFHEEVKHYKTHWWKCNGPCQNKPPYYGSIKRSTNRAPGPNDFWWNDHRATCGGEFIKVKEPEDYVNKKLKKKDAGAKAPVNVLENYFPKPQTTKSSSASTSSYKSPNTSDGTTSPAVDQFRNYASSSIALTSPGTSNGSDRDRGQRILGLVDLNVKKKATGSLLKSSNQNSTTPNKGKFVALPGHKKAFQFINDNDWS